MRRREFITLLGGAAAAWPLGARAQQSKKSVVGYLNSTSPTTYANYTESFQRGLRSIGYADGENISIVHRWAEGQNDRLPALAADLVRHQVDIIVATGATAAAVAAKAATSTIPVVFITGGDPVEFKLVDSFNKPGGNLTGISFLANALASKQLELMHEIVPCEIIRGACKHDEPYLGQ
jgi:putative tryptophan/tyrosine transport system substrate-binding protein